MLTLLQDHMDRYKLRWLGLLATPILVLAGINPGKSGCRTSASRGLELRFWDIAPSPLMFKNPP
jgi:hypothetical protein